MTLLQRDWVGAGLVAIAGTWVQSTQMRSVTLKAQPVGARAPTQGLQLAALGLAAPW